MNIAELKLLRKDLVFFAKQEKSCKDPIRKEQLQKQITKLTNLAKRK